MLIVLATGYLVAAIVMLAFGFETKGLVLETAALEKTGGSSAAIT